MSRPIDPGAAHGPPAADDDRRTRAADIPEEPSARPAEPAPVDGDRTVARHAATGSVRREPGPALDHRELMVRQRQRFGGMKVGSAFFGWLAATGLFVTVVVALAVLGVGVGVVSDANVGATLQEAQAGTDRARTIGLIGAIVLAVILFVAYLAGGYVSGRMARFSGAAQGVAVWLWGVVITALTVGVAAIGAQQDILDRFDLPALQIGGQPSVAVTVTGIAIAAAVALIGAVLGGLIGMRFHRRVDRAALEEEPYDEIDRSSR